MAQIQDRGNKREENYFHPIALCHNAISTFGLAFIFKDHSIHSNQISIIDMISDHKRNQKAHIVHSITSQVNIKKTIKENKKEEASASVITLEIIEIYAGENKQGEKVKEDTSRGENFVLYRRQAREALSGIRLIM